VQLSGIISEVQRRIAKSSGLPMATFTLSDMDAKIRCVVFTKSYPEVQHMLVEDQIVAIKGRLNERDDEVNVIIDRMKVLDIQDGQIPVLITARAEQLSQPEIVYELKRIIQEFPGERPVRVAMVGETTQTFAMPGCTVTADVAFCSEVKALLGGLSITV
jgi:DNA polymerase-3 subunit alpha